MKYTKKFILVALVVLIGWGAVGATAQTELSDSDILFAMDQARFEAFRPEDIPPGFNPRTDNLPTGLVYTLEIEAVRPDGNTKAVVQVSQLSFATARIDYLEPAELAGDVFIASRFEDSVVFWNPDLITPLQIDGAFEVFGDATVWEVMGIPFGRIFSIEESTEVTMEDGSTALSFDMTSNRSRFPFSKATVTADPETLQPITLNLFDQDGDPLHENTFVSYTVSEDGRTHYEQQVLNNLVVPGNQTLLTVIGIDHVALDEDFFDPGKLSE